MTETGATIRGREWLVGGVVVLAIVLVQLWTLGPPARFLSLGLVVALGFWARTRWNPDATRVLPVFLLGIAVQCWHFAEEYVTGFQRQFPRLYGYQWEDSRFVLFNLLWISVFVLAGLGVLMKVRLAYLFVFFLALVGGIGNGIAHVALALTRPGYFPGVFTAPVAFVVGVLVLRRLYQRAEPL